MTLDAFIDVLRMHAAGLRSGAWSSGPALYLDAADTDALLAELVRMRQELRRRESARVSDRRFISARLEPAAVSDR
jgi:hypothetical protein